MEKTLQQQEQKKVMDAEQFDFHQKQQIANRDNLLMIRPIIEVMEEDNAGQPSPKSTITPANSMEVDEPPAQSQPSSFTARLGPSGLSPLVVSELNNSCSISQDYVTKLLPRQPLDLAVNSSSAAAAAASAAAMAAHSGDLTGLGYDPLMLRHHCTCDKAENHPEHPGRLRAIWNRLVESGLANQCARVARKATLEEIQSCHSETHTLVYGTDMVNRCNLTSSQELNRDNRMGNFCGLSCGGVGVDADTFWNELETPAAVRTAVGTMIEMSKKVKLNSLIIHCTLALSRASSSCIYVVYVR